MNGCLEALLPNDMPLKVSDQLAEDMLYQQYLREERQLEFMIARNNQSSRNS